MTNEELTVVLLDKLGWEYDLLLNPGHYKNTIDLLAGDLILCIFNTDTTVDAAKLLNVSYKTLFTASERFLRPKFGKLNGGGETWKFRLLHELEYKVCGSCRKLLPYTDYHIDRCAPRGINADCKICRKDENAVSYQKESTKEAHKRSNEKHKFEKQERNIKYKGERALRVPKWSQTKQIVEFYKNCPENNHVDHVVPLKGELVSGLHVIENLQYLTAEDNMRKGNKYIIE